MKVILTMDVPDLGTRGDCVVVSAGYARNFLMPRRLAVSDTLGNQRIMAEESKLGDVRAKKAQGEAQKVGDWLSRHEVLATLKIGREGKAFGSVTSSELAILLRKAGLEVDRRRIRMSEPIRRLGVFEVPLAIHPEVETNIRLYVDREGGTKEGAAERQAEWDADKAARDEIARIEEEARAERAREAEEVARIAIEKAAARRAREEEEAAARAEAQKGTSIEDGEDAEGPAGEDA